MRLVSRVAGAQLRADAAVRGRCVYDVRVHRSPEGSPPPLHPFPLPAVSAWRMKRPLSFSADKYEATAIIWAEQIGPYGALLSMQGDAVLSEQRQEDGRGEGL